MPSKGNPGSIGMTVEAHWLKSREPLSPREFKTDKMSGFQGYQEAPASRTWLCPQKSQDSLGWEERAIAVAYSAFSGCCSCCIGHVPYPVAGALRLRGKDLRKYRGQKRKDLASQAVLEMKGSTKRQGQGSGSSRSSSPLLPIHPWQLGDSQDATCPLRCAQVPCRVTGRSMRRPWTACSLTGARLIC
eukprot:262387-Pelagomonas_calceolata.AAC.2